ncbi:hypothetical protein RF11_09988 [Thelohanellus kitauei]|uniref:Uncharacterized protein n=1 Tax=Thelohanellus kitauei TaxID=669202 RepID=A0A0C2J562_THEKT|nr:hypothetical protein RF11_09988 [Thelohanellus kitauei]
MDDLRELLKKITKEQVQKFIELKKSTPSLQASPSPDINLTKFSSEHLESSSDGLDKTTQTTTTGDIILSQTEVRPEATTTTVQPSTSSSAEPNLERSSNNTKKSEISDSSEMETDDSYIYDTFVDELAGGEMSAINGLSKRKEIISYPSFSDKPDLGEQMTSEKTNGAIDQLQETRNESEKTQLSQEIFNFLAKEGWKQFQKLSEKEKETKVEVSQVDINYLHWNFETYVDRKVLGSPGNPLKSFGNPLFSSGSLTFLGSSEDYLNGGDYSGTCMSGIFIFS